MDRSGNLRNNDDRIMLLRSSWGDGLLVSVYRVNRFRFDDKAWVDEVLLFSLLFA